MYVCTYVKQHRHKKVVRAKLLNLGSMSLSASDSPTSGAGCTISAKWDVCLHVFHFPPVLSFPQKALISSQLYYGTYQRLFKVVDFEVYECEDARQWK